MKMCEKIVAAAIIWKDDKIYIWARHHHCFCALACAWVEQKSHNHQWFVLADWTFLDRYDARVLAENTNQMKEQHSDWDMLFSEDLR